MSKQIFRFETRALHYRFGQFAGAASSWLGSTWAFAIAGVVILIWAAMGPLIHFSSTWIQAVSMGTGLATFFIVFLIQNIQNRNARAVNLKLNELILAMDKARNQMIDIERLSDLELEELHTTYERVKTAWSDRQMGKTVDPLSNESQ